MPARQTQVEKEVTYFRGQNTANNPAEIPLESQRKAYNAYMPSVGVIAKRPGSQPVTTTALGATVKHITSYKAATSGDPDLYGASGTTLYKFTGGNAWTGQTMTNALATSDIYTLPFTNSLLASRLIIADGGSLKAYNGTAVANIAPASDDTAPAPANYLTAINAKLPKYVWGHNDHIFVAFGTNEYYYSKRYEFDYFPVTFYFLLVRENDYINGAGVTFDNVCLIPMRRGWNILTGEAFDTFDSSTYLNTVNGVIAPRSIAKVTYPTGAQSIVYLSDDGVYEIYRVDSVNSQTYATKSLMKEKFDFSVFGFTAAEKAAAVGYFDSTYNLYILAIVGGATKYKIVMDTRSGEWYVWTLPTTTYSILRHNGVLYYAGSTGHLHKYDAGLYTDWDQVAKTSGAVVDFDVYSGLVSFEFSGKQSYLDYYIVRAKTWNVTSSLDVYIVYGADISSHVAALQSQYAVWDVTGWDVGVFANLNYTDLLNTTGRIKIVKKGEYFQRRWRNNRDEPVEIYAEKLIGRLSNKI